MKEIILKDGSKIEATDNSTIQEFCVLYESSYDALETVQLLTDENLSAFTYDGMKFSDREFEEVRIINTGNGYEGHFKVSLKVDKERIHELEAELAALRANLQETGIPEDVMDKANGYDALLGITQEQEEN